MKSCGLGHGSFYLKMWHHNKADHLRLKRPVYEAMLCHLEAVYPQEGCGLLAGYWSERMATVLYAIANRAANPQTQFLMLPSQQIAAFLEIDAAEMDLLAIYHSHPHGPATPSAADMAQAYYPDVLQLVVSLAPPQPSLRAFWLTPTAFSEIAVIVE
jgi:[CysO sulfur-carrier protein]-S-L-cysteine hydrolase